MATELKELLEMMAQLQKGQEAMQDRMDKGQREIKEEFRESQEKTKTELKETMEKNQEQIKEEFRESQEKIKNEIKDMIDTKFESMENRVGELENHFQELDQRIEGRMEEIGNELEKKMEQMIEEKSKENFEDIIEMGIQEKLEERLKEFRSLEKEIKEMRKQVPSTSGNIFPDLTQNISASQRSLVKLLTYDGKSSWKVYKTQFSIVAEANGWDEATKACQLAASLRGDAANILERVPENRRQNFEALTDALEMRFGDNSSKDLARIQLKARQQKSSETLQEFAAEIDRLTQIAFTDCPQDTRENLAIQYFIDGVRDAEIQRALRMTEYKDLKAALAYATKFEAAQLASRRERHLIRAVGQEPLDSAYSKLLAEIEDLKRRLPADKSNNLRSRNTCWQCGGIGHTRRFCRARQETKPKDVPSNVQEN